MKRKTIIVFIIILSLSTAIAAVPTIEKNTNAVESINTNKNSISLNSMIYSLKNLYTYLDSNFLYDIDNEEMLYELIEAMVNSLGDKYSYFVGPDEAEKFQETTEGQYVGIGTYLTKVNPEYIDPKDPETYMVVITSPFPGGPADRAGLRARDMISAVNGEDVSELTATEASKLIRGKEGEAITLTIHRGESVFDITLIPEVVTTPTSDIQMLDDSIGYLRISQFSAKTFESVYDDVLELLAKGATSIIIDLRNNGGGVVDSALSIANMFISEGTLLTTGFKPGSGNQDTIYTATEYLIVPEDMPIVVLINEGTASASEILTAALKENDRATIVGSKSFGKGIMQHVLPYMEGFLNITVAHYYTPDGNDIHNIGITPDYIVEEEEYSDEEIEAYAEFLKGDNIVKWREQYPEYSKDNIEAFANANKDSGVPFSLLCLLMRNEYIYALDYDERPIADLDFDTQLRKAVDIIKDAK